MVLLGPSALLGQGAGEPLGEGVVVDDLGVPAGGGRPLRVVVPPGHLSVARRRSRSFSAGLSSSRSEIAFSARKSRVPSVRVEQVGQVVALVEELAGRHRRAAVPAAG